MNTDLFAGLKKLEKGNKTSVLPYKIKTTDGIVSDRLNILKVLAANFFPKEKPIGEYQMKMQGGVKTFLGRGSQKSQTVKLCVPPSPLRMGLLLERMA